MNRKRKSPSPDAVKTEQHKRYRMSNDDSDNDIPSKTPQPRVDPTYGQRGAFPGLESAKSDEALFYGPASDGLEYLRMVRWEAKTVPNLLVAKSATTGKANDLQSETSQGFYSDGAYTAAQVQTTDYDAGIEEDDDDPQKAYYSVMCARFRYLSSMLQDPPPSDLILPAHLRTAQRLSSGGKPVWRSALNTIPSMAVLGQLPQESILLGLRMLELRVANGDIRRKKSLSLWAWGLLAKCREVGQMQSEDIGILRDLGKRAVWLVRSLRAGTEHRMQDHEQESGDSSEDADNDTTVGGRAGHQTHSNIDGDHQESEVNNLRHEIEDDNDSHGSPEDKTDTDDALAAAKARILSSLPSQMPAAGIPVSAHDSIPEVNNEPPSLPGSDLIEKTMPNERDGEVFRLYATLDMIITIVGECYGQRDLLDGRLVWGEIDMYDS